MGRDRPAFTRAEAYVKGCPDDTPEETYDNGNSFYSIDKDGEENYETP